MKCPNCGYEEGNHVAKLSDEEYFMEIWTPTLGLEEAKKSWLEKQNAPRQTTHMVMSDIQGHISMADGTWISSRSKHRENLKRNHCIELGNDVPMERKAVEISKKSQEARKRQIAEIAYEKLKY
jgi:hypothetical protein